MVAEFAADTDPDWKPAAREIHSVLGQIEVVAGAVLDQITEPDAAQVDQARLLADEAEGLAKCFSGALLAKADIPHRA